jgi:chaperonin cofactor prefoldin
MMNIMPTFKEYFGIKPKQPKEEKGTERQGEGEDKKALELEEAKRKFVVEKPKLERRLAEIPVKIKELEEGLTRMKGPEMRRILDKEFELNSAMSPDSTDQSPRGRREFEDWQRAINISKGGTQEMKADLGRRIDGAQKEISGLEKEKREIESRIQRGY